MPVTSLKPGYIGTVRDRVENYHGNLLVFVHWEKHLNFCAAIALALPPSMLGRALLGEILPSLYGNDPDWVTMDRSTVRWTLDGTEWMPDPAQPLREQGVGHKSLIRFWTNHSERT